MIVIGDANHARTHLLRQACHRQSINLPIVLDYLPLVTQLTQTLCQSGLYPPFVCAMLSAHQSTDRALATELSNPPYAFATSHCSFDQYQHRHEYQRQSSPAPVWEASLLKALNTHLAKGNHADKTTYIKLEAPAGEDLSWQLIQLGALVAQNMGDLLIAQSTTHKQPQTHKKTTATTHTLPQPQSQMTACWQNSWQSYLSGYFLPFLCQSHQINQTSSCHSFGLKNSANPPSKPLTGEIAHQSLWFVGWLYVLFFLQHRLETLKLPIGFVNDPDMVVWLTDKWAFTQRLADLFIQALDPPVGDGDMSTITTAKPLGLLGTHPMSAFDELQSLLQNTGERQVFIKSRYGSSGSGVLAYRQTRQGKQTKQVLYANVLCRYQQGRYRLFNTLKPQKLTQPAEIKQLITLLAGSSSLAHSLYVERWIPKPRLANSSAHFDVRLVSCAGQSRQGIARASTHPLTNLHLGNERLGLDECMGKTDQQRLYQQISQLAGRFERCGVIGFDVIYRQHRHHVLEANAFGDWLTNVTYQGCTAYDDQVAIWG